MDAPLPCRSTLADNHIFYIGSEAYDVYKIIRHAAPIVPIIMEASALERSIVKTEVCWIDDNAGWFPSTMILNAYRRMGTWEGVLEQHPEWMGHIKSIKQADYTHPLLMYNNEIIDGNHRALHALVDKAPTVMIKILEYLPRDTRFLFCL